MALVPLILTTAMPLRNWDPHFIDEETGSEGLNNLPKFAAHKQQSQVYLA